MSWGVALRELVVEKWVKPPLEGWFLRKSLVPTTPFLDPYVFDWVPALEQAWPDIRTELDAVSVRRSEFPNFQSITPEVGTITDDDQWKTFFFLGFGHRGESNLARCPATAAALDEIPGITTAFFSILEPGKHVPEHRGPYRGLLRYHLGLRVPDPPESCGIEVEGEVRHWVNGGSLLFDDCYPHSVWNDSREMRAVLFLDVIRPMSGLASWFNKIALKIIKVSPFVRTAKRNYDVWERQFNAREMPAQHP